MFIEVCNLLFLKENHVLLRINRHLVFMYTPWLGFAAPEKSKVLWAKHFNHKLAVAEVGKPREVFDDVLEKKLLVRIFYFSNIEDPDALIIFFELLINFHNKDGAVFGRLKVNLIWIFKSILLWIWYPV